MIPVKEHVHVEPVSTSPVHVVSAFDRAGDVIRAVSPVTARSVGMRPRTNIVWYRRLSTPRTDRMTIESTIGASPVTLNVVPMDCPRPCFTVIEYDPTGNLVDNGTDQVPAASTVAVAKKAADETLTSLSR